MIIFSLLKVKPYKDNNIVYIIMNQMDFVKLFEYNKGRDYVFYECGITHKNIENGLTSDDERLLITKGDMYKNANICYNVDNINSNEVLSTNNDIYNNNNFVIDLDNIWEWLGFSQKARAKNLLEKHFILNKDYIKTLLDTEQQKKGRGGHNKEVLLMNVKTFNLFCLKADTDVSNKIHEYYIKLERLFIKSLDDECILFTKNTQIEGEFIKSIDELIPLLTSQKCTLTRHLIKNYKENYHYIIDKTPYIKDPINVRGGHNYKNYMLTEYTFELLKNSYNLRNKYITNISENVKCINIGMCIENQTIGFIENSFQDVVDTKRQYIFDKYKVDLYFPEYKLVIECDENNHDDRNPNEEKIREEYILSLGNSMIRFNPNDSKFELSIVLREINKILFSKESIENIKLILLP